MLVVILQIAFLSCTATCMLIAITSSVYNIKLKLIACSVPHQSKLRIGLIVFPYSLPLKMAVHTCILSVRKYVEVASR